MIAGHFTAQPRENDSAFFIERHTVIQLYAAQRHLSGTPI